MLCISSLLRLVAYYDNVDRRWFGVAWDD